MNDIFIIYGLTIISIIITLISRIFITSSYNKYLKIDNERKIKGEYYLEYDEGKIYYVFLVNNGSYIKIEANNGEVIATYYFNGIYS